MTGYATPMPGFGAPMTGFATPMPYGAPLAAPMMPQSFAPPMAPVMAAPMMSMPMPGHVGNSTVYAAPSTSNYSYAPVYSHYADHGRLGYTSGQGLNLDYDEHWTKGQQLYKNSYGHYLDH